MVQESRETLKVGWIPYWNLYPLKKELLKVASEDLELVPGHPAVINRWLAEGKVDLAPCSSVCLLRNASHEMAMPLGVASLGAVGSVFIGFHREDREVLEVIARRQRVLGEIFRQGIGKYGSDARRIASFVWQASDALPVELAVPPPLKLTPASETSATLSRILYRLWFGKDAFEMLAAESQNASAKAAMSMQRPLELLIGDEALVKKKAYVKVLDLGEVWRELTDLPFVFAVWQTSGKGLKRTWRRTIMAAAELAQARMRVDPSVYLPDLPATDVAGHSIDLAAYWKHIQYGLNTSHFRGLALFLSFARLMAPAKVDDMALAKIMRWEALSDDISYATP